MKIFMNSMGLVFLLGFVLNLIGAVLLMGTATYLIYALSCLAAAGLFFFLGRVTEYMKNKETLAVMIYRQLLKETAAPNDQEAVNKEVIEFRNLFKKVHDYI